MECENKKKEDQKKKAKNCKPRGTTNTHPAGSKKEKRKKKKPPTVRMVSASAGTCVWPITRQLRPEWWDYPVECALWLSTCVANRGKRVSHSSLLVPRRDSFETYPVQIAIGLECLSLQAKSQPALHIIILFFYCLSVYHIALASLSGSRWNRPYLVLALIIKSLIWAIRLSEMA